MARCGNEELACVLPGGDSIARIMQKDIKALAIPHTKSTCDAYVTMSFGIASVIPKIVSQPAIPIEASDSQLYLAKRGGRNRIKCIDHNLEDVPSPQENKKNK